MKNFHYPWHTLAGIALMFTCCIPLTSWSQKSSDLKTMDATRAVQKEARTAQATAAASTVLRIKVTEDMAARLTKAQMSRTSGNALRTGIGTIDALTARFDVQTMKRVYRPAGKFEARHQAYGLHLWYEITVKDGISLDETLAAFKSESSVSIAEKYTPKVLLDYNHYEPIGATAIPPQTPMMADLTWPANDYYISLQWHYNNTGSSQTANGVAGRDISLAEAWELETGSPDVIVSIVDGGVQTNHPDLAANMWINTGETPGNGIDDDSNGYVDDYNGYNFVDDTGTIAADGHGTHVGGTVAAVTNNSIGVAGIAGGDGTAGSGARIMTCQTFTATSAGGFDEAIVYSADMGAVISQNSWGYDPAGAYEQSVLDAIDYFIAEAGKDSNGNQVGPMAGGIVIVAAGNDNSQANWYPAYYSPTLAVSATTNRDGHASYSNYGTWVDISAPGGDGISSVNQMVASTYSDNGYAWADGTSMACPHVSGVAALVVSYLGGTGFTPATLRSILVGSTDDIESLLNNRYKGKMGSGRLNAYAALTSTATAGVEEDELVDNDAVINSPDWETDQELTLSPVPAKEELMIQISGEIDDDNSESLITIVNLQGQIFYQRRLPANQLNNLRVPIRELGLYPGLYHISISGKDVRKNQLFIKE